MITFDDSIVAYQQFPFRNTLWNYVLQNVQPQHLLKLYQCCKFFYAKYRQNIIQRLEIVDDDEEELFDPTTTIICASNPTFKNFIDIWISDSVIYSAPLNHKVMPFFSHCTIKKLDACDYLIWEEFEALTKAGTIKEIKIGVIYDDGDDLVPVDKIIAQVPNAASIHINNCEITPSTFTSLVAMEHKAKITNFVLENLEVFENPDFELLIEYMLKNTDAVCNVNIVFKLQQEQNELMRKYNKVIENFGKLSSLRIASALQHREHLRYRKSIQDTINFLSQL